MRIEVGPRDVAQGTCVAARRDRPGKEGKQFGIPLEPAGFVASMRQLLNDVHVSLSYKSVCLDLLTRMMSTCACNPLP